MEINEFIDNLSEELGKDYILTYDKDYKWYNINIISANVNETVIITERVLRCKDRCYARIKCIKQFVDCLEQRLKKL